MSEDLESIAATLVADGKGILAADESVATLTRRFDTLGIPSTEQSRRAYREMLFTTRGAAEFISGAILYDETIRQKSSGGMKVTTPVPVEGGVAGGALPMSAGTSFHGRRKPNGSACHRRTMAGVQDEAKHAMSAMSPLKSCDVEKPQPQR